MRVWFFILMSPIIFIIGGNIFYNIIGEGESNKDKNIALAVGFCGVLAFWAFYFL